MGEPLLQVAQKTATPGEAPVHSVKMLFVVAIFTRKWPACTVRCPSLELELPRQIRNLISCDMTFVTLNFQGRHNFSPTIHAQGNNLG